MEVVTRNGVNLRCDNRRRSPFISGYARSTTTICILQ